MLSYFCNEIKKKAFEYACSSTYKKSDIKLYINTNYKKIQKKQIKNMKLYKYKLNKLFEIITQDIKIVINDYTSLQCDQVENPLLYF